MLAAILRRTFVVLVKRFGTLLVAQCASAPGSGRRAERLGLEPSAFGAVFENVGDADCGLDPLDPALH
jgi:hypothetical protein